MAQQVIFIILAVITLGSALLVVTLRNLFHAALAMMLTFLGIAGVFALLEAGFLAATQLLVYIGAISILIIFAIMMTRRLMSTTEAAFNSQWGFSLFGAILIFGLLTYTMIGVWGPTPDNVAGGQNLYSLTETTYDRWFEARLAEVGLEGEALEAELQSLEALRNNVDNNVELMGRSFVGADAYVIPFELTSVLLLAALIGAVVIARPREDEE